jgi:hypothetical protein
MCSPMPDLDPEEVGASAPPACGRWPGCDTPPGGGSCVWPECVEGER